MINLSKYENKTVVHNTYMVDKDCSFCFLHIYIVPLYSQMQAVQVYLMFFYWYKSPSCYAVRVGCKGWCHGSNYIFQTV